MSSRAAHLARTALRTARSLPGYRTSRTGVQQAVRRSPTARRALLRLAGFGGLTLESDGEDLGQEVQTGYPAVGLVLQGRVREPLPTVLVHLLEVPDERVAEVVHDVAVWQLLTAAFRPVFLVRQAGLAPVRAYGYVAELAAEADAWGMSPERWRSWVQTRIGSMTAHYHASGLLEVGPAGLSPGQMAFLSHLRSPLRPARR